MFMVLKSEARAYCIEYFHAKPAYKNQLVNALLKLVTPSRAEEGCLQYDLLQDNKDPNLIILIVQFTNQEMMSNHEKQSFVTDFSKNELQQYCEKLTWSDANAITQ